MSPKKNQHTRQQRYNATILVATLAGIAALAVAVIALMPPPPAPASQATLVPASIQQIEESAATLPPVRPTLPPTWTPHPTQTAAPTEPATVPGTSQPTTVQTTPFASPDPARMSDTYWHGDGYGSMADAELQDGAFARFTFFPVKIWIGAYGTVSIDPSHEQAISNALAEIGRVVPVQRVDAPTFSHVRMWLMTDSEFNENATCDQIDYKVGCTQTIYTDVGIMLVTGWLRVTDECFDQTLLHELTHAMGIRVHSPHPEDLMYYVQTCQAAQYSPRDLATLRMLYSAPPYNPRGSAPQP